MELSTERLSISSILREISLRISPGELTGIVGPNGAGKTTLLRCLAGELAPTSGTCTLGSVSVQALSARERARHLAYLPQQTVFSFPFTTAELVGLQASSPDSLERALSDLDLGVLAQRSLLQLSGGERQRAAIARVLAQGVQLLLLDEPLAQLDLRHQLQLLGRLRQHCQQGGTVVAVLHDLRLARQWCDQLLLLGEGRLVAQGAPQSVLTEQHLQGVFGVSQDALA